VICPASRSTCVTNPADARGAGGTIAAVNARSRCCTAAVIAALALAGPAAAEPATSPASGTLTIDGVPGRRVVVDTPLARTATPQAFSSRTLYLNRCTGGCTVIRGNNDARNHMSSIPGTDTTPNGTTFKITEYELFDGSSGAAANDEWRQVVRCLQEVYSPYNLTVTDVQPPLGTTYDEAIIAGFPDQIGQDQDVLGVAPLASNCAAIDNAISFSFANKHGRDDRVNNICWTAAQESAHAYGLDHEFVFTTGNVANGHSACNDPMTYRGDCGGEKFFRNEVATCGEAGPRTCHCGGTQNSHAKLQSVFGTSTAAPIVGRPSSVLVTPAATDTTLGFNGVVTSGAQRGVSRVDLYFNGFKWADAPGAAFGMHGQPNPSTYVISIPTTLPNSIVDVKAIAYDDLGAATESGVVTVTKGGPCTTATTCAKGQKCEAGKCFWDPPVGEIGASCPYSQFCKSLLCTGTAEQQICTQTCTLGSGDGCPDGFDCVKNGDSGGVCFFAASSGCCSVDRGGGGGAVLPVCLGLAVLGWVARPRRWRRRR
jgi:hypothetical protein